MIAVLKAGGAFLIMDPEHPTDRLMHVARNARAKLLLTSKQYDFRFQQLDIRIVRISFTTVNLSRCSLMTLPTVSPRNLALVIYTSGSTGEPKGILLEHLAICTSLRHHAEMFGFGSSSRVFQFASYSFDAAYGEILCTLMSGGCICVPSRQQRMDNLADAMTFFRVDTAHLTPTVLQLLSPSQVPTLKKPILGGEPVTREIIDTWAMRVNLINLYGPAECSVGCVSKTGYGVSDPPNLIGRAMGCKTWIVTPGNYNMLVPVGAVGELLIEGPGVARGYLSPRDGTESAFCTAPAFMNFKATTTSARCYRTGDLVRYLPNGELQFVGRNDGQLKIRGQRVELREAEHALKQFLPAGSDAVVEAVRRGSDDSPVLVAFLVYDEDKPDAVSSNHIYSSRTTRKLPTLIEEFIAKLKGALPSYLIPEWFTRLSEIPTTASEKIDRRTLRLRGSQLLDNHSLRPSKSSDQNIAVNDEQKTLKAAWSQVLRVAECDIHGESNFFDLGGDSVSAMRLSGLMRSNGLSLSVEATFRNPRFLGSSSKLRRIEGCTAPSVVPFSLMESRIQPAIENASRDCRVAIEHIQDIYPCTPFQASIMASTARKPGSYINTFTYSVLKSVDLARYVKAWETVYRILPILRTRIVLSEAMDYQQVVVIEKLPWFGNESSHDTGLPFDRHEIQMQLGDPLIRLTLRHSPNEIATELIVTIHHALYDGWSLSKTFALVKTVYAQDAVPADMPGFNSFVKFAKGIERASSRSFWQTNLKDAPEPSFPTMSKIEQGLDDGLCRLAIKVPRTKCSTFNLATVSRVAWGLVLSKYENTTDVVFGNTVSGRNADLDGVASIVGPTLTTVPVRVKYDPHQRVIDFLRDVQANGNDMIRHEQFGLSSIAQLGPDERRACNFRTMLIVQTPDFELHGYEETALERLRSASPTIYGFPLTISLYVGHEDAAITAKYNSKLLDDVQVTRLLQHFDHTITLLCTHTGDQKLADLNLFCQRDLEEVLTWNEEVPARVEVCIHDLISRTVREYPRTSAIECSEGAMSYEMLELRSNQLACHLSRLGVTTESFVPLCFDKSRWAVVAMLSVLKAGGAFVPLESAHPDARIKSIMEDIKAHLVIASLSQCNRAAFRAGTTVVTLNEDLFSQFGNDLEKFVSPATPQSAAYALFTSGTTGRPKGFIIEHAAYCSGALVRGRLISRNEDSRVLQFASYGFDPSIEDILTSLIFGSCICIPSRFDMENSLGEFMTKSKVNFANLTPSFAATLQPSDAPTLQTLLLSGEPMTEDLVHSWANHVKLINGYGPSECCIKCALNDNVHPGGSPTNIGFAVCSSLWIVDPNNTAHLAPIGAIGELIVEGPCLSRGYIRTSPGNGFIPAPSWLRSVRKVENFRVFQTGDLVRYQSDGSILFIGRKDKQVKINGQRTELSDIEQHLRTAVPSSLVTAVELVTPKDETNPILVAFSSAATRARQQDSFPDTIGAASLSQDRRERLGWSGHMKSAPVLKEQLARELPSHMVPKAFLGLDVFPLTMNGKTHRKALRDVVHQRSIGDLIHASGQELAPLSKLESTGLAMWKQVLGRKSLNADGCTNFFDIGGDSIAVIRLAALARRQGYPLSAARIHQAPLLKDLAEGIMSHPGEEEFPRQPFGLVASLGAEDAIVQDCGVRSGVQSSDIEDVFPCTNFQERFMENALRFPGAGTTQAVFPLRSDVDLSKFRSACELVARHQQPMRTRIVHTHNAWLQVVIKEEIEWELTDSLDSIWEKHGRTSMGPGTELNRFAIVDCHQSGEIYFVWTANHAVFDAWSMTTLTHHLDSAYAFGSARGHEGNFGEFVRTTIVDADDASKFWQTHFRGVSSRQLCKELDDQLADTLLSHTISLPAYGHIPVTLANVILCAWALVIGHLTASNDTVLCLTLTGRDAPVDGIDSMVGLFASNFPFRVALDSEAKTQDFLVKVQAGLNEARHYQHTRADVIRNSSADAREAFRCINRLEVHPAQNIHQISPNSVVLRRKHAFPMRSHCYPMITEVTLGENDTVDLEITFDSRSMSELLVAQLMEHFETILKQLLLSSQEHHLCDLSWEHLSSWDLGALTKTSLQGPAQHEDGELMR